VQALLGAMSEFDKFVVDSGSADQFTATLDASETLKNAIQEEFDVQGPQSKRQRSLEESTERRAFQKRV
jgi:hypothetical protein